ATHNAVDELTSRAGGGALRFAGSTNEAATVTIAGKAAQTSATNDFSGTAAVTPGTNSVAIVATDPSGNTRTNTYNVTVPGGSAGTLAYDRNGNLTSDGTRMYEWDGVNRLTTVNQGTHRTEFTYDGFGRRARVVEKDNSSVTSDKRFLWVGAGMIEERDGSGGTVTKRFLSQ